MLSTLFSDDFEAGSFAAGWAATTGWTVQNSVVHAGAYAASRAPSSNNGLTKNFNAKYKQLQFDLYFRISGTNSNHYIYLYESDNSGYVGLLRIAYGGALQYSTSAGWVNLPTATTVTSGTWYHVVITLDFAASTMGWTVDGSSKGSVSLDDNIGITWTTATNINYLQHVGGSSGYTIYVDDYYIYSESNQSIIPAAIHTMRMRK